jgi:hypothetical protein
MGGTRRIERSLLHVAKTELRVSRLLERRGCAVPLALAVGPRWVGAYCYCWASRRRGWCCGPDSCRAALEQRHSLRRSGASVLGSNHQEFPTRVSSANLSNQISQFSGQRCTGLVFRGRAHPGVPILSETYLRALQVFSLSSCTIRRPPWPPRAPGKSA